MVAGKRTGLAQQSLDHVPVINHRLPAGHTRDERNLLGAVVNLQVLLINSRPQPSADEPGRHRIRHAFDPDGAVAAHPALYFIILAEPRRRQLPHPGQFLRHFGRARSVGFKQHRRQELIVSGFTGKVPIPTQQ